MTPDSELPEEQIEDEITSETTNDQVATEIPEPRRALVKPLSPTVFAGARIQRKREACGLTRYAFERLCNVSVSTIRALERGHAVKESNLAKIETCLDALLAKSAAPAGAEKATPADSPVTTGDGTSEEDF